MTKRSHKWRWTALLAGSALLLPLGLSFHEHDLILYNHSPSIPAGFYARTRAAIERGAIVTVRAVDVAPAYARLRSFADGGDRFIKRVAAEGGDHVCANGERLVINGTSAVRRVERDSAGRSLPMWADCRTLKEDEVLLLGDTEDSFDGRYWGPVSLGSIEGVWRPLPSAQH